MLLLLCLVIPAQPGAHQRTLDYPHDVAPDTADDGGRQRGQDAAIHQALQHGIGTGVRSAPRVAEPETGRDSSREDEDTIAGVTVRELDDAMQEVFLDCFRVDGALTRVEAGREIMEGLKEGQATIRVTANRASSWATALWVWASARPSGSSVPWLAGVDAEALPPEDAGAEATRARFAFARELCQDAARREGEVS